MNRLPIVAIGGPYTRPSPEANLARMVALVNEILDEGVVFPLCPMIEVHYLHVSKERDYDFWLDRCIELMKPCDYYLYLSGESSGVEKEKKAMEEAGKPIFATKENLYRHVKVLRFQREERERVRTSR